MRDSLLLFLVCSITGVASGQIEKVNYTCAIKAYNLSRFTQEITYLDSGGLSYSTTTRENEILHPTVAVQWHAKGNRFHELELTDFSINNQKNETQLLTLNGQTSNTVKSGFSLNTNLALRYEYQVNVSRSKDKRLIPGLGVSLSAYFKRLNFEPETSTEFASMNQQAGMVFFIIPRLSYHLSKRMFLDLNFPLYVMSAYFDTKREENPLLPPPQQTVSLFGMQSMPDYFSFRIGLGVKL